MRSGSPALQSVEIRDWTSCSFSAPGRPPIEAGSHGRPACSPTRSPCPGSLLQRTATTTVSLTDQEASLAQLRHDTPPDISEARSDIRPPGQQPQAPPALAIYDEPTPLASAARRARRRGPQRAARGPPRRAHCRRNACSAPTPPSARSRTRCSAPAPLHALGGAAELVTRRVLHCPSPLGWLRLPAAPHAPLTRRRSATNPTCRAPSAGSSRAPPEVRYQRASCDQRGRVLQGRTPAARQPTGAAPFGLLLERSSSSTASMSAMSWPEPRRRLSSISVERASTATLISRSS
jgi:hypothetical protein